MKAHPLTHPDAKSDRHRQLPESENSSARIEAERLHDDFLHWGPSEIEISSSEVKRTSPNCSRRRAGGKAGGKRMVAMVQAGNHLRHDGRFDHEDVR